MPILQGRSIEERDRPRTLTPAVISARTARMLWPEGPALGREFTRADPTQRFEVVGVVVDGRVTALESDPPLMVYVPYWYNNEGKSVLVVRADGDSAALLAAVRTVVRDVDPDVAIAGPAIRSCWPASSLSSRPSASHRLPQPRSGACGSIRRPRCATNRRSPTGADVCWERARRPSSRNARRHRRPPAAPPLQRRGISDDRARCGARSLITELVARAT